MDAATLGVVVGGLVLGAGFYWSWAPEGFLGSMEPYLGHGSFRQMRVWVWVKFLTIVVPVVFFFPEADAAYPSLQPAYAAFLVGFSAFHVRFLATREARWDTRAGVRPFPTTASRD
ncbi:hypothetical protein ACF3M1_01395 [Luteimonas sp. WGS1318]|uniref:hypothetical protein n=1 Tax=Luteimonas sp. WGS1318 TaxID=3366815 RepID=UPI00372D0579